MDGKIDVAVLGLGGMGATHVRAAKDSPRVNAIHGYEPEEKRAEARGRELGIKATSDLRSILRNPEIKLVFIAAVNSAHSDLARKSLEAGKSVMCEKPMGETLEEAGAMIRTEEETGNFLQIGFELRYSKMYTKVKEWIDGGLIGRPVNCHCRYYCNEFHGRNSWRSRSRGTLIGEKLSHYIDLTRWYTGSEIEEVFSMHAPNVVDYFQHPDNHQINFRFENGAVSNLNFVMYVAEDYKGDPLLGKQHKKSDDGHSLEYCIMGTKGIIETDLYGRRLRRHELYDREEGLANKIVETVRFSEKERSEWTHNTYGQNLRVCELAADGKEPETPSRDSYETMKAGFAAEISESEKRIVRIEELD